MQLPHLCWRMSSQAFYNVERKLEDCLCCLLRSPSFLSLFFWGGGATDLLLIYLQREYFWIYHLKTVLKYTNCHFLFFVVFLFIIFQFILLISYGFPTLFSCCFLPPPPSNLPHPLEFSN